MSRSPSPPPRRGRSPSPPRGGSRSIIIQRLTKNVTEDHLDEIFGVYGKITDIDFPIIKRLGTHKGTAYITYSQASAASKAISHMDRGQIDGQDIIVEPESPPPSPVQKRDPRRASIVARSRLSLLPTTTSFPRDFSDSKLDHMPNFTELTDVADADKLLRENQHKLVVRAITPKFNALTESYKDVTFAKADVDVALDLSKDYSVRSMPTFKFIKYNKKTQASEVVETLRGSSPPALEDAVERNHTDDEEKYDLRVVVETAEPMFVDGTEWGHEKNEKFGGLVLGGERRSRVERAAQMVAVAVVVVGLIGCYVYAQKVFL
ncbi:hypothetical protein MNV49_006059 [Pseudohyphozyma bogoriensis]|nr:hypothetical protein MNV49_006059 [Pseudohyphozyma bogoriensis]